MHRRTFLAACSSGTLLGAAVLAAEDADSSSQGLSLGFGTYGMKSLSTEQAIELIAEVGFDAIELTIRPDWDVDPGQLPPRRRGQLRQQLVDSGLQLTSLMEQLHVDESDRRLEQRIERIKLAAELAHDLAPDAPPLLQTTLGGGGDWQAVRSRYADELAHWADVAEQSELTIAVKPHRGGAMNRPEHAAELLAAVGRPERLRMCYDYSHYDLRDMTLQQTVQTALPILGHVAVKDVIPQGDRFRFLLPGESGRIDYSQLLRLLHDGGYRGDISCEVSGQIWSRPDYEPAEAARICYNHLSQAFQRSGVPRR